MVRNDAAPEMLEALVSIREVLVAGNQGVFEDRIISESLEICEKVLKKARSEG